MRGMYGGVHVQHPWPEKEALLEDSGGYTYMAPEYVYLPMRQHVGEACTPVVQVGDRVAVGDLVGSSEEAMSALVHSSVSGTVTALEEIPVAGGGSELAVIIHNDRQDTLSTRLPQYADARTLPPDEIVDAVRSAGIVGMGGARFPTHIKLRPKHTVDLVLVNGCECEPMQAADDALMQQEPLKIMFGLAAAMRAVGAAKGIIGIEANKPLAAETMEDITANLPDVEVRRVESIYPQGGEKQLIQALSGREAPVGGLPSEAGVVVLNTATCAAIADALQTGQPLTHRICTVTGDVGQPRNLLFPIGTPAAAMIDACEGFVGTPSKVIAGGPMMGKTLETLTEPMLKGSNGLIVVNEDHDAFFSESPCIRCNRCAEVCPMRLQPLFIDRAWRDGKTKACARLQADSCIACGCCTYVCPARRRLAEKIVEAKGEVASLRKEGAV